MIKRLRAHGVPRYDFLVHGVCKAGGGWEPYPTKEDFIRHLDALQAAEKTGEIRIVTYDEIRNGDLLFFDEMSEYKPGIADSLLAEKLSFQ